MRRILVIIPCILLLYGCSHLFPVEGIYTGAYLTDIKIGFEKDFGFGKGYIREFIPRDEDISSWTRINTIQFFEGEKRTPKYFMELLKQSTFKRCGSKTAWAVLEEKQYSITYEWSVTSCAEQGDQSEVARLIQGNDGLHRIAYAEKNSTMNQANKQEWLSIISSAYLVKGSPKNHVVIEENNSTK